MPTIAPVWPLSSHFGHGHGGGALHFRDDPNPSYKSVPRSKKLAREK